MWCEGSLDSSLPNLSIISSVKLLLEDSINNHKHNTWCASRRRSSTKLRYQLSARASCLATLCSSDAFGATGYRLACQLTPTTSSPCQSSVRACRLASVNNMSNPQFALVDVPWSSADFVLEAARRAYERATFDDPERTMKATITSKRGEERVNRELAESTVSRQPCVAHGDDLGTMA